MVLTLALQCFCTCAISIICHALGMWDQTLRLAHRPGATEAQLNEAEAALGVRLPEAVRAMYRVHDGQELPADVVADTTGECQLDSPSTLHGIFGG
jgi:cell wall assembly regulator SMI1